MGTVFLYFAAACCAIYLALRAIARFRYPSTENWPTIPATITVSEHIESFADLPESGKIEYRYVIDGTAYWGNSVGLFDGSFDRSEASKKYIEGSIVTIRYNPDYLAESILTSEFSPELSSKGWFDTAVFWVSEFAILGVALLLFSMASSRH